MASRRRRGDSVRFSSRPSIISWRTNGGTRKRPSAAPGIPSSRWRTRDWAKNVSREPVSEAAPERAFDQAWATTVLEKALTALQEEFARRGRAAQFEDWKIFLTREATVADCEASARRLNMSAGAVTVAVHRLRERYGELLREAVAHTVPCAADVEDELRYLFSLLNE